MKNFLSLFAAAVFSLALAACVNLKKVDRGWDSPPYFALERHAEIEGINLTYLECGNDNPENIVFIHGLSGNVMNWWDQFEDFRDDYHILIPDLPGHGKSGKPENFNYSVESFAGIIVALMDQAGMDQAAIVGNSLGGAIAGYLAIHYPDRVNKLVLSDSAGVKISSTLKAVTPFATPITIRWSGVTSQRQYPGTDQKNRVRADFSASYRDTTEEIPYLKAIDKSLNQIARFDFSQDLPQIKAPTLIIWGSNDKTVPFKVHQVFVDKIPDTKLYVVGQGGHTPNMSKPAEFDCALENFLAGKDLEPCHQIIAEAQPK